MATLPGTPGERIADLCNGYHITQKELAKRIGVSAPQMSRIVSGETKTVSSDILIAVANEFKVSTDFILGLTDISVRKNYDISELGLSEKAVRGLVTNAVDVEILNRLLEHKHFPYLTNLIRIYFEDTAKRGVVFRNQIIEMATSSLSDQIKNHPENRVDGRKDLQFMNAQKLGEHEAEMEKIKSVFLTILRDIKKDIDSGKQPEDTATSAMLQAVKEELKAKGHEQKLPTMDDIANAITDQLGQLTPMDEQSTDLFKQLMKSMMKQSNIESDQLI